jgi:mannosyltransferase
LYVGSRAKYKNFDFLVESISETSYCLDICGAPLSIKEQEFLNQKLGINRYKVYSNVDNATLNELYNQAKCLIYPSSYEGFGLPIVEAQKTGCPVIALNSSSIPEIIGETPLLLNELSAKELFSLLEMIESPTLFENVSKMGLENAKKYTSQSMIDGYRNIYSELLE